MTDELENRKKPKATLIKHKKEEEPIAPPPEESAAPEKKKVVVVKKKILAVKKPEPEVSAAPEAPPVEAAPAAGLPTSSAEAAAPAVSTAHAVPAAGEKPAGGTLPTPHVVRPPLGTPAGATRVVTPAHATAHIPPSVRTQVLHGGPYARPAAPGGTARTVPGAAAHAAPGAGPRTAHGAVAHAAPGAGTHAAPGAGTRTAPGAGTHAAPGAGTHAVPGAGTHAAPGAGTRAAPGAAQPGQPHHKTFIAHVPSGAGTHAASAAAAPGASAARPAVTHNTPAPSAGVPFVRPAHPEPKPSVRLSQRLQTGASFSAPRVSRPPMGAGRPPFAGGGGSRPPFPGGPRPAPSSTAKPGGGEEEKKGTAKKFFKARKKIEYPKRKHMELAEKHLQVKKKTVQMANPVPKEIAITEAITVSDLAKKMNLKASELISKLMHMGSLVTINQQIDADTVSLLAAEYGCAVKVVSLYDETVIETESDKVEDMMHRPPIVTIMGHVDHGKTSLLDVIRKANVADSEYGGITQHIGAYAVELPQGRIIFLDTPGHEAFTMMRARGAMVTDIVVLVVSAADGVMPQTVEAINHAKEAKVPIIVAVNKMDLPDANPDLVKRQLTEQGLSPEDWGGTTIYCPVSALKKTGITELLDAILVQSEVLELKASPQARASGIVLESRIDLGRGIVATVIVQKGTLRIGDSFVAGIYAGKVRALFSDKGQKLLEATPSEPVEVLGFTSIPNAGDPFQVTDTEKTAKTIGSKRQELKKLEGSKNVKKVTLDNLYEQIKEGQIQELKVIIKADVNGSVEAVKTALERLSTNEVKLVVIHSATGAINEGDVLLASTSNGLIVGFHVRPSAAAQSLADREKVDIRKYNIIYDAIEDIKSAMEGLLKPELREEQIGTLEVRNTFKIPKIGTIAGCQVKSGKVRRGADIRLIREGIELFKGKITSLKRFKEDTREVEEGYECGIGLDNFHDIKEGDVIEVYEVREIAKKLEGAKDGGAQAQTG